MQLRALALAAATLALVHCAPADEAADDAAGTDENSFSGIASVAGSGETEPAVAFEDDPSLKDDGAGATCSAAAPACDAKPKIDEHAGLRSVDSCSFHLGDRNAWATNGALVDRLAKDLDVVSVGDVLADANRDASDISRLTRVEDFKQGFKWNLADTTSLDWWPQGITGSADADLTGLVDGRRVLVVTFYDKGEGDDRKGVRIALVDITNPKAIKYRFALLVTVKDVAGRTEIDPVKVHAGGVVWYGRYLYIPDTGRGLRVFDMERILRVPDQGANIGWNAGTQKYSAADYKYIVPQVDDYMLSKSCPVAFSFASLDRSTTPHSLVTGEYKSGTEGRLVRWNLDRATQKLAAPYYPKEAFYAQQSHIQGALSWKGTWWVQSAAQSLLNGKLYRLKPGQQAGESPQPPGIEDLYHDPTTGLLWSLTEYPGFRFVYAAPLSAY